MMKLQASAITDQDDAVTEDGHAGAAPAQQKEETEEKEPPHCAFTRVATVKDALHPALRKDPKLLAAILAGMDRYIERLMEVRLQGQLRFQYGLLAELEPIGRSLFLANSYAQLETAFEQAVEYHRNGTVGRKEIALAYRNARDRKEMELDGVPDNAFRVSFEATAPGEMPTDLTAPLNDDIQSRTLPQFELHLRRQIAIKVPGLVRWRLEGCVPQEQPCRKAVIRWWSRVWTRAIRMATFTIPIADRHGVATAVVFPDPLPRKKKQVEDDWQKNDPEVPADEDDEIIGEYDDDPEDAQPPSRSGCRPAPYWRVGKELTRTIFDRLFAHRRLLSDEPATFGTLCGTLGLKVPGVTGRWHKPDGAAASRWTPWDAPGDGSSQEWRELYHPMIRTMEREVVIARGAVGNHPKTQASPSNPPKDATPKPKRPRPLPMRENDTKLPADGIHLYLPYVSYLQCAARACEDAAATPPNQRPPRPRCRRRPRNRRRRHHRRPRRRLRKKRKPAMRSFTIAPVPQPAKVPFFRLIAPTMMVTSGCTRKPAGLLRCINATIAPRTVHGIVAEYERIHGRPERDTYHPPASASGSAGDAPSAPPPTVYAKGEDPMGDDSDRWWEPLFAGLRRRHLKEFSERGAFIRSMLTDGVHLRICFQTDCPRNLKQEVYRWNRREDLQEKLAASVPYRKKRNGDIWTNTANRTTRAAIKLRKPQPEKLQDPDEPVETCEATRLGDAMDQFQTKQQVRQFFDRFHALAAADPGIRNLLSVVSIPLRGTDMPGRLADIWEDCRDRMVDWRPEAWKVLFASVHTPVFNWTGRHALEHDRRRQTRFREQKHRAGCGIGEVFRRMPSLKSGDGPLLNRVQRYSVIVHEEWRRFREYAFGHGARMRSDRALRFGARSRHVHHGVRDMVNFAMRNCPGWGTENGPQREEDGRILLAMGAAVTKPGMAGHAPAPHRGILAEIDRNWPNVALVLTDEFRTSKCHWACGDELVQQDPETVRDGDVDEHGRSVVPKGTSIRFQRWIANRRRRRRRRQEEASADDQLPERPKPPRVSEADRIEAKRDDEAFDNWLSTPEGVAATTTDSNGRSSSRVYRCPTDCCGNHNIDRDVNGALNIMLHLITTLLGQRRREGFERKWEIEERWQREEDEASAP